MEPAEPPELFRIVVRSLVACVLVEVVFVGALAASGWRLPWQAWVYAVGWGLGAGAALAVAEAALWRAGLVVALALGACLAPLAPLGATFELTFAHTWSVEQATTAVLDRLLSTSPTSWAAATGGGALFLYGPLLVALRRRAAPRGQALAMLVGALLWALIVWVVAPWPLGDVLAWRHVPLVLFAPALIVPPGRWLGDRLVRRGRPRGAPPPSRGSRRRLLAQVALLALAAGTVPMALRDRGATLSAWVRVSRTEWRALVERDADAMLRIGDVAAGLPVMPLAPTSTVASPPTAFADLSALSEIDYGVLVELEPDEVDWFLMDHDERARQWYRRAALLGAPAAVHRMLALDQNPFRQGPVSRDLEIAWWLRQAAAGGDVVAALNLGVHLIEGRWLTADVVTLYHGKWSAPRLRAPIPGSRPTGEVESAREGLRWLRLAAELGDAAAKYQLQHGLRVATAATPAEALARLAEARWRVPTLPASWADQELEAIERARAALAVGSAPHGGGDRP